MKKFCVLVFSLLVTVTTVYGLVQPSYHLRLLFDLSEPFTMARFLIAALLVLYLFWPEVRTVGMKTLMLLIGGGLLGSSLAAFFSPTLFGYSSDYIPIGDVFIFLEGGILALLLAAELPVHKPRFTVPGIDWQKFPSLAHPIGKHPRTT